MARPCVDLSAELQLALPVRCVGVPRRDKGLTLSKKSQVIGPQALSIYSTTTPLVRGLSVSSSPGLRIDNFQLDGGTL